VLAVDGNQPPSPAPLGIESELSRRDEALLVREREVDAALERPERRREAGETDDGVEDEIGLGAFEELRQIAADLRQRSKALEGLRPGGRRYQLELGMGSDDLQRLPADRARCAEERDSLHLSSVGSGAC